MEIRRGSLIVTILLVTSPAFAGEGSQRLLAQKIEQPAAFDAVQTLQRHVAAEKTVEQKNVKAERSIPKTTDASLTVAEPTMAVLTEEPLPLPGEEERLPASNWNPSLLYYQTFNLPDGGYFLLTENFAHNVLASWDSIYIRRFNSEGKLVANLLYNKATYSTYTNGIPGTGATNYAQMITLLTQAAEDRNTAPDTKSSLLFIRSLLMQRSFDRTTTNFSVYAGGDYVLGRNSKFEVNRVDDVIRVIDHSAPYPSNYGSGYSINLVTKTITYQTVINNSGVLSSVTIPVSNSVAWREALNNMMNTLGQARNAITPNAPTAVRDRDRINALIRTLSTL